MFGHETGSWIAMIAIILLVIAIILACRKEDTTNWR